MKLQTALSHDGENLYLIVNTDDKIVIDMNVEMATELMGLLFELIKEAKAQQTFLKLESSDHNA
jgi:hypothetical protein